MISRTTHRLWRCFDDLPEDVRDRARRAFEKWRGNPSHPGLQFKCVHTAEAVWSVRITRGYRALGMRDGDTVTWFWIGSHDDYERTISRI